jgi:hypothetical protein
VSGRVFVDMRCDDDTKVFRTRVSDLVCQFEETTLGCLSNNLIVICMWIWNSCAPLPIPRVKAVLCGLMAVAQEHPW